MHPNWRFEYRHPPVFQYEGLDFTPRPAHHLVILLRFLREGFRACWKHRANGALRVYLVGGRHRLQGRIKAVVRLPRAASVGRVEGEDAVDALDKMVEMIETEFD